MIGQTWSLFIIAKSKSASASWYWSIQKRHLCRNKACRLIFECTFVAYIQIRFKVGSANYNGSNRQSTPSQRTSMAQQLKLTACILHVQQVALEELIRLMHINSGNYRLEENRDVYCWNSDQLWPKVPITRCVIGLTVRLFLSASYFYVDILKSFCNNYLDVFYTNLWRIEAFACPKANHSHVLKCNKSSFCIELFPVSSSSCFEWILCQHVVEPLVSTRSLFGFCESYLKAIITGICKQNGIKHLKTSMDSTLHSFTLHSHWVLSNQTSKPISFK